MQGGQTTAIDAINSKRATPALQASTLSVSILAYFTPALHLPCLYLPVTK